MTSTLANNGQNTFKVLIVDDEQEFVISLIKRLNKRGLLCEGVYTGGEALTVIQDNNFDVVLLDMKLPDINGNEVLRSIKQIKPETQVIILTGHISAQDGIDGLDGGACNYLMKPVEFESLFESLKQAKENQPVE